MFDSSDHSIEIIIEIISKYTGLKVLLEGRNVLVGPGIRIPYLASIRTPAADIPLSLIPFEGVLGAAFQMRLAQLPPGVTAIVYADSLPISTIEQLKKLCVGYIDLSGELFLPLQYKWRTSPQPPTVRLSSKETVRGRQGQLEQLIFALLSEPELHHHSHRMIAREIGMAHSTVHHGLATLVATGMIEAEKIGINILQAPLMLEHWIGFFAENFQNLTTPEVFRSSLHKTLDPSWWKSRKESDLFWSGDIAAIRLGEDLRPERFLIYCAGDARQSVMKELRLVPDPKGTIELRKCFWDFSWREKTKGLAPLPLIYSDLILTRDSRAVQAARSILERIVNASANRNR